jgi:hypothetical protein
MADFTPETRHNFQLLHRSEDPGKNATENDAWQHR